MADTRQLISHDRNGNQLTKVTDGQTETRVYNAFNQLVQFTNADTTATYNYRTDGLRHSKLVNGVPTTHTWDRGHIVLERGAWGSVIRRYRRCLTGRLIECDRYGVFLYNVQGDVVQIFH